MKLAASEYAPKAPLEGPLGMVLTVYRSTPKSFSKRKASLAEAGEKATGVRPNTVSQWVNNEELREEGKEVKSISVEVLNAFCRELKCSPNDILEYTEE